MLGGRQRKARVKPEQSRTCLNFHHVLAVNPTEPVFFFGIHIARSCPTLCANFSPLLAMVKAARLVKGGRVNIKPYRGNPHFIGTCQALVVDRTGPVFSHIHIVHPCSTLCKFQPATRNGLGCTPRQMRPCRDPGHRQTHLTQIVNKIHFSWISVSNFIIFEADMADVIAIERRHVTERKLTSGIDIEPRTQTLTRQVLN